MLLKDRQINIEPGTDGTVWQLIAQGDTGAVLNTRGDLIKQGASASERLPIGVSGSVLTTDGSDPIWSNAEGKNVIYVSNSGSDTLNDGSQYRPYKTIYYALSQTTSGDLVDFDTITGGTGGVAGTYSLVQTSSTGIGTGVEIRAVLDGSSTPTIIITNGGKDHAAGDVITFTRDESITATVKNERQIDFRGEETSVSGAALILLQELGYTWNTVNGWGYWLFDGETIAERLNRLKNDSEESGL